jgi:uncharacterized protein (DUF4415 family)
MTKKIVKYKIDPAKLPPVTRQQKAELAALAAMPDKPLTEQFWKTAIRNPFYRPVKQATTVRIDADVLQWLKSNGKGYQTRINTILRDAMLHQHEAG